VAIPLIDKLPDDPAWEKKNWNSHARRSLTCRNRSHEPFRHLLLQRPVGTNRTPASLSRIRTARRAKTCWNPDVLDATSHPRRRKAMKWCWTKRTAWTGRRFASATSSTHCPEPSLRAARSSQRSPAGAVAQDVIAATVGRPSFRKLPLEPAAGNPVAADEASSGKDCTSRGSAPSFAHLANASVYPDGSNHIPWPGSQ